MTVRFQPAGDNVLVHLFPNEEEWPENMVDWAEVVAVGPGLRSADGTLVAPDLAPGDRIALRPHTAMRLLIDGLQMAVAGGPDILGVLLHEPGETGPGSTGEPTGPAEPAQPDVAALGAEESPETDVAPDLLDREAPTAEDLH